MNEDLKYRQRPTKSKTLIERCLGRSHQPPTHLYIPNGKTFTHVCPDCGQQTVLMGSNISW